MSNLESNKAVCKAFFTHLGKRDFAKALNYVADDIVWWVQGDWEGAGFYEGLEAVKALLAPLKDALATDVHFTFINFTAEDNRVACEMTGTARTMGGADYRMTYHFLLTIKDGKIHRGKEYLDTKHLWDVLLSKYSVDKLKSAMASK